MGCPHENLPHTVSNGALGALIAGLKGSASGGQAIALPILAPHYLGLGVDANALHRVVAIASGGLDSLPHNGTL
jgi:H+/gluconate symporter-like permease